jgi:hypothetical protein
MGLIFCPLTNSWVEKLTHARALIEKNPSGFGYPLPSLDGRNNKFFGELKKCLPKLV